MSVFGDYLKHIKELNLDIPKLQQKFGYDNPVLICVDAVLSINRQYQRFVWPRVQYFEKNNPTVDSLDKLINLIGSKGEDNFKEVWNYNHPARVVLLKDLTDFFIRLPGNDDIKKMKKWANDFDIFKEKSMPVKGIGFATTQYIRKLLGVDTVKPDVHIKRSVELGTGHKPTDAETVRLLQDVAKELEVHATELDNAIWRYYSLK